MKKLAVLLTTLALGSTAALADPGYAGKPYDGNLYTQNAGVRERHLPYRPHATWSTLAYGAKVSRRGSLIDVSSHERFAKLNLSATGSMIVDRVVITFQNGATQLVDLNRRLGWGSSSIAIDLDGNARRIDKIAVYGRGGARASLKVMAI
jgi:hypothetical protein